MLATWWVWVAAGLALAILEVVVPGYIFVGFALGAVLTGVLIGLGLPGSGWMLATPLNALLVFALMSLACWLILRRVLGRRGQSKRIHHDINDG
ncbi:NfeD family protein [Pararhodobacter sp.]|uniref:NfeD family protein n=1 Tax=Pararhodobacter sp. TaxID=2127056 RepID=UPI003FA75F24